MRYLIRYLTKEIKVSQSVLPFKLFSYRKITKYFYIFMCVVVCRRRRIRIIAIQNDGSRNPIWDNRGARTRLDRLKNSIEICVVMV